MLPAFKINITDTYISMQTWDDTAIRYENESFSLTNFLMCLAQYPVNMRLTCVNYDDICNILLNAFVFSKNSFLFSSLFTMCNW